MNVRIHDVASRVPPLLGRGWFLSRFFPLLFVLACHRAEPSTDRAQQDSAPPAATRANPPFSAKPLVSEGFQMFWPPTRYGGDGQMPVISSGRHEIIAANGKITAGSLFDPIDVSAYFAGASLKFDDDELSVAPDGMVTSIKDPRPIGKFGPDDSLFVHASSKRLRLLDDGHVLIDDMHGSMQTQLGVLVRPSVPSVRRPALLLAYVRARETIEK